MYVMGGDTFNGDMKEESQTPGLLDQTWGTGYKNDGTVPFIPKY